MQTTSNTAYSLRAFSMAEHFVSGERNEFRWKHPCVALLGEKEADANLVRLLDTCHGQFKTICVVENSKPDVIAARDPNTEACLTKLLHGCIHKPTLSALYNSSIMYHRIKYKKERGLLLIIRGWDAKNASENYTSMENLISDNRHSGITLMITSHDLGCLGQHVGNNADALVTSSDNSEYAQLEWMNYFHFFPSIEEMHAAKMVSSAPPPPPQQCSDDSYLTWMMNTLSISSRLGSSPAVIAAVATALPERRCLVWKANTLAKDDMEHSTFYLLQTPLTHDLSTLHPLLLHA